LTLKQDKNIKDQLHLLAQSAGLLVEQDHSLIGSPWHYRKASHELKKLFPGRTGTIDTTEVGLVLGWLANAGFVPQVDTFHEMGTGDPTSDKFLGKMLGYLVSCYSSDPDIPKWIGVGDTVEAALTEIVIKLPIDTVTKWTER